MKTVFTACVMVLLLLGVVTGCRRVVDPDTTAPTVDLVVPADTVTGVAINAKVVATFDEPMDAATITADTFTVTGPGTTAVAGAVTLSSDGLVATFAPTSNLAISTAFTATITTGAKDVAGNALASAYGWTFTTGATADSTRPTVASTEPGNGTVSVATTVTVRATFSEAMDPATITTGTFKVTGPGTTALSGTVTMPTGTAAVFTPENVLAGDTLYTATITTGAKDIAGNAFASNFVWSFTTGTAVSAGPEPVILGTAANYAILAKSGVTTVPTSSVTGHIGASPIDSTAITGFSLVLDSSNQFATSSQVIGRVYASNYAAQTPAILTTAVSDMETAYTDAAGRATPDFTELYAGNIGGQILVPGLYKWSTAVSIPTGVTLSGGPDDVWIFQIAEDLTVSNGVIVLLSGGAQPKNIFWQVGGGSGLILGSGAHFEGIVLAQKAISLGAGASVNGRLLAQTAVTLVSSTVAQPMP